MAGPHHVLFEGNYSHNFDSDYTHGNAIYLTIFRNVLTGQRRSFTDVQNLKIGVTAYGSWWDFLRRECLRPFRSNGRLELHRPGDELRRERQQLHGQQWWLVGCGGDMAVSGTTPSAGRCFPIPKVLIDGHSRRQLRLPYEFAALAQHAGRLRHAKLNVPDLKTCFPRPNPWPWANPATGALTALPAKARYDAGTPNG